MSNLFKWSFDASNGLLLLWIWVVGLFLVLIAVGVVFILVWFYQGFLSLVLSQGSFLNADDDFGQNEPYKSAELALFVHSVSAIQTINYPRPDFLKGLILNWETKLHSELVNVGANVVKNSFTFGVGGKSLISLEVFLFGLQIVVVVLHKVIKK